MEQSMTVHLVNFTNPMMLKGPFRELLPVGRQELRIRIPENREIRKVQMLVSRKSPDYQIKGHTLELSIDQILDHEVVAIDF
jgi:hypothetical protein